MKNLRRILIIHRLFFAFCIFIPQIPAAAQSISILSPDMTGASRSIAAKIETALAKNFVIVDDAMGRSAFLSTKPEDPFNMTTDRARAVGGAIGCDYFILVSSAVLRRSSYKQPEYYESHAAIYAVSSRTGRLVFWRLPRYESLTSEDATKNLENSMPELALELQSKLKLTTKQELAETAPPEMEEPPEEGSPSAKGFQAPIPYRRVKPEYTSDAFLYGITATVDIVIDLNSDGKILRTKIERWAGYGLDESVEKAVRSMNWRPATRNGKALPMRFLVRYNFKKIEKDQAATR